MSQLPAGVVQINRALGATILVAGSIPGRTQTIALAIFHRWAREGALAELRRSSNLPRVLLRGLTVDEVSKRLGYTDTSTFCHAFKRWHGVPPSAYPRTG